MAGGGQLQEDRKLPAGRWVDASVPRILLEVTVPLCTCEELVSPSGSESQERRERRRRRGHCGNSLAL